MTRQAPFAPVPSILRAAIDHLDTLNQQIGELENHLDQLTDEQLDHLVVLRRQLRDQVTAVVGLSR